jgi:mRNA interferase MazF
MKDGDIVLTSLPQADNKQKLRPALVLRIMPAFNDLLLCGISSNLRNYIKGFDEIITRKDKDFESSGLKDDSLIRLGFICVLPKKDIAGSIGNISSERHKRLLKNLAAYLTENI